MLVLVLAAAIGVLATVLLYVGLLVPEEERQPDTGEQDGGIRTYRASQAPRVITPMQQGEQQKKRGAGRWGYGGSKFYLVRRCAQ